MAWRALVIVALLLTACASAARQEDTRGFAAKEPGGRVVELSGIAGKFAKIESVSLYFYPGEFEIPLYATDGRYRGDVSKAQVDGMARQPHGFRVYRARLTIVSSSAAGERDTKTQDLTIALEP